MTRGRKVLLGLVVSLAAATAGGLSSVGAHTPGSSPHRIWVGSGGLYVRATLGSHCWRTYCADAFYPLKVRGRLPVDPRDRVTLIVRDHARRVHVSLLRVQGGESEALDWRARARRPSDNPHRWRFRLPAALDGADRLDVFVRYRGGDADFWAGLKPSG